VARSRHTQVLTMFPDLQLYQANLDISRAESDRLWHLLSEDERSRVERYKHEQSKRNFIAARGNLREILAPRLGCESREIEFGYGDRGKPYIKNPQNQEKLFFNLAHSRDWAIYALCGDREVGIDLEYINLQCDVERIAKRYFLPSEQKIISSLNNHDKYFAFYRAWTLKEAYGKATGEGIANILDVVNITPLLISDKTLQIQNWTLKLLNSGIDLDLDSNYAAAIAIRNHL